MQTMYCLLAILFVFYVVYKLFEHHRGKTFIENTNNRHVLITGCDSGFGNELARLLDKRGVPVFAAFLTEKGAAELKTHTSSRLRVLQLDVTNQNSIHDSVEFVKRHLPKSSGLWGLVNNAGLQILEAPLEFHSHDAIQKCISVNLLGTIDVTKSFLPLLRKAKGRLVFVSSVCAMIELPCRVPYVTSKVGVEALAECLRRELYHVGVTSHTIQPGSFKTKIVDPNEMKSTLQKAFDSVDVEVQQFFGQQWLKKFKESFSGIPGTQCEDLSPMANTLYHALFSVMPKRHGMMCEYYYYPISLLPGWFNTWYWKMSPPPDAVTCGQSSQQEPLIKQ